MGALSVHVLQQLVIFMTKQKISEETLQAYHYLLLKYCNRQSIFLPLPGSNHKIKPQNVRF